MKAKSPEALVVQNTKEDLKLQRWRVGRDSFNVNWIHNPNKIGFLRWWDHSEVAYFKYACPDVSVAGLKGKQIARIW